MPDPFDRLQQPVNIPGGLTDPRNPQFWFDNPEIVAQLLGIPTRYGSVANPVVDNMGIFTNPNHRGAPLRDAAFRSLYKGATPADLLDTKIWGLKLTPEQLRKRQGGGPV